MSETLTMQPENTGGELTAEEQDSLAVGEAMMEQQDQLLAGKYKNAEELEQGYINLQKKLGNSNEEADEDEDEETDESEEESVDEEEGEEEGNEEESEEVTASLQDLWENIQSEEDIDDDLAQSLLNMNQGDLIDQYLEYRKGIEDSGYTTGDFTEQDMTELKSIAGGDKEYDGMMRWASANMPEDDIALYDQALETGNPLTAFFAVQALTYKYMDETGKDGEMLTGKTPSSGSKSSYRSQAEVVRAMGDPRYENDPAYRQDVMEKLERSNLDF